MTGQASLPGMPEERRNEQIGIKLTSVEKAKLGQSAATAEMELAAWCRQTLLQVASGDRASHNVEVPIGDLKALEVKLERLAKIALAVLAELYEHCFHGDPQRGHEDEEVARKARRRAAAKMADTMTKLGLNGG